MDQLPSAVTTPGTIQVYFTATDGLQPSGYKKVGSTRFDNATSTSARLTTSVNVNINIVFLRERDCVVDINCCGCPPPVYRPYRAWTVIDGSHRPTNGIDGTTPPGPTYPPGNKR